MRECVASLGAAAAARPRRADAQTNQGPVRLSVFMALSRSLQEARDFLFSVYERV